MRHAPWRPIARNGPACSSMRPACCAPRAVAGTPALRWTRWPPRPSSTSATARSWRPSAARYEARAGVLRRAAVALLLLQALEQVERGIAVRRQADAALVAAKSVAG